MMGANAGLNSYICILDKYILYHWAFSLIPWIIVFIENRNKDKTVIIGQRSEVQILQKYWMSDRSAECRIGGLRDKLI